jgi:hypothetical protein
MGARATPARTTQLGCSLSQVSPAFLEAIAAEIAGLACGRERRSASLLNPAQSRRPEKTGGRFSVKARKPSA